MKCSLDVVFAFNLMGNDIHWFAPYFKNPILWNLRDIFSHQPKQPYHDFVNITARINIYNNNLKRAID